MGYWLVLPAAGSGQRIGGPVPKQYLPLRGRCSLLWALEAFLGDVRCLGAVVAIAAHDTRWPVLRAGLPSSFREAPGGAQRADSVANCLQVLRDAAGDGDDVLVHDAARPCVSRREIDALLAADAPDGALLALPLADTLKRDDAAGRVAETPTRTGLWRALTPQRFPYGLLRGALEQARRSGRSPTDEAQAVEWLGRRPRLVAGDATNIKITTAADFALAEAILAARAAVQGGADER
jgi:2-C-methyl-D-erythritol 4-phosphate cytidylyltransferase